MKIFIGTDHAGFDLKQKLVSYIGELGYDVEDMGAYKLDSEDDYPDVIFPVANSVSENLQSKGIILGGSGQGEAIVANRVKGVRTAVYYGGSLDIIRLSREHNNANILSLGARFISEDEACEAVKLWLGTEFSGEERHARRIKKIDGSFTGFDDWNNIKKNLDNPRKKTFFKERDIFYVRVGKNIGFEQDGKSKDYSRPVVVLRKFNNDIFLGVPLSTTKRDGKYYFHFQFKEGKKSVAILSQVRLFDGKRFMDKIGMMGEKDFEKVKEKTKDLI